MTSPKTSDKPGAKPRLITRRRLFKAGLGLVAGGATVGAYAHWIEPTWLHVVRLDLPVAHLPPAWEGTRVALIADLHHGPSVPLDYLARAVDWVRALEADIVAVSGDLVIGSEPETAERVAALFHGLAPPCGLYACLGNHDYGGPWRSIGLPPSQVAVALERHGVRVLRNESVRLERGGQPLWVAGTDDYWIGHFNAAQAMRGIPAGAPNLVLCHNPEAIMKLEAAGCGTILMGHTHGGQVQLPLLGPVHMPKQFRQRYDGLHHVGNSWMYITRGVGWAPYKVRFNCRPEISLLTLRPAPADSPAA